MPLDPTTGQVDTPPSDTVRSAPAESADGAGDPTDEHTDPSDEVRQTTATAADAGTDATAPPDPTRGNATGSEGVAPTMSTAVAELVDARGAVDTEVAERVVVPDGAPPPSRILPGETGDEIFNRLIVPEIEIMWRVAMSLTRNRADAEDVVQEALLRAYRAIHTFDGRYPRAWVLTILRNTEHNRHRRKRPQLLTDPDTVEERGPATEPDIVEQYAEDREFDRAVVDALARLPENFRQVIELVDIDGLAYQEAADVLDIPLGTVMSRLHRARRRIRELLIPLGYGPHGHGDHGHTGDGHAGNDHDADRSSPRLEEQS